jgi:hypothetical protein
MLAQQEQGPEFKPWYHQKKKKKVKENNKTVDS